MFIHIADDIIRHARLRNGTEEFPGIPVPNVPGGPGRICRRRVVREATKQCCLIGVVTRRERKEGPTISLRWPSVAFKLQVYDQAHPRCDDLSDEAPGVTRRLLQAKIDGAAPKASRPNISGVFSILSAISSDEDECDWDCAHKPHRQWRLRDG